MRDEVHNMHFECVSNDRLCSQGVFPTKFGQSTAANKRTSMQRYPALVRKHQVTTSTLGFIIIKGGMVNVVYIYIYIPPVVVQACMSPTREIWYSRNISIFQCSMQLPTPAGICGAFRGTISLSQPSGRRRLSHNPYSHLISR